MAKYAIYWKSIATGATGNGQFLEWPSLEAAERHVASMNRKYTGEIHHWLVAAEGQRPRPLERLASRMKNPRKLATDVLWYGISAAWFFWLSTQGAAIFWFNAAIFAAFLALGRLIRADD